MLARLTYMRGSILIRQKSYPYVARRHGPRLVFRFSPPVLSRQGDEIKTITVSAGSGLAGVARALERNAQ